MHDESHWHRADVDLFSIHRFSWLEKQHVAQDLATMPQTWACPGRFHVPFGYFCSSMNPFVVSARKYRPATFDTVVGQAHITNTLKNAIRTSHLAQAFLFCGPRGVGKTTCARILAKTLNCRKLTPEIEACNSCESCLSFNNGQSLNIYELDAASNNSVDDIRSLVEQVRYAPHAGEYKIYIIDEVHMLSTSAFNAFLKTLEEPPSYAIFILATTEKHKIIPTILSRCQIFDFNRIEVDDIASHLAFVAGKEGVQAEEEALHIIAQKADGALRDALSIFDQIVSFAGNTITYKDVINNLSILDYESYFQMTDAIRSGHIPEVLVSFNGLLAEGFDGHQFINGLASHFRDLLMAKDEVTLPLLEVSKSTRERYRQQAQSIPQEHLLKYLGICSQCDIDYRMAKNQRLHVELALLRLCSVGKPVDLHTAGTSTAEKKKPESGHLTPTADVASPASPPPNLSVTSATATADSYSNTLAPATAHYPTPTQAVRDISNPVANIPSSAEAGISQSPPPAASESSFDTVKPAASAVLPSERTARVSYLGARSMTKVAQKAEQVSQVADSQNTPDEGTDRTVSSAELQEVWKAYAEQVKKEGKLQLYTTLTMSVPTIDLNGFEILFALHNPSQQELLIEEGPGLMDHLRTRLNHYRLTLKTKLDPVSNDPEAAFTNKEKYLKMAEKNPELDAFRRQLGLELEL